MSDIVRIRKIDSCYVQVIAEPGIKMELSDLFTFKVPGAQFSPKYKMGVWDGQIRLCNVMTGRIYAGLVDRIAKFCKVRDYTLELEAGVNVKDNYKPNIAYELAEQFELPSKFKVRDYQAEAVYTAMHNRRTLLLSPTASGKSLIIYLLTRYHIEEGRKVLIVVPTTSLVEQMTTDFIEYNNDDRSLDIHKIRGGMEKHLKSDITISTWQSIFKQPKEFFRNADVIIGDEAHLFKAKSLTSIMEKLVNCEHRYAFTGTLDGTLTNEMVLNGLFGPTHRVVSTTKLIDDGHLAKFDIKALVLDYSDEMKKLVRGKTYQEEIDFIVTSSSRNKYIKNLVGSLEGNILILFQFVEKHGKVLEPMLSSLENKEVHFVHGGVKTETREDIRRIVEKSDNAAILASYGTFSTGINIKKLDYIIFASPSKSKIRNLQSIGRVLRIGNGKTKATLFDIVDNLQWKNKPNFAIKHFIERVKTYNEEGFEFKSYVIKLKD